MQIITSVAWWAGPHTFSIFWTKTFSVFQFRWDDPGSIRVGPNNHMYISKILFVDIRFHIFVLPICMQVAIELPPVIPLVRPGPGRLGSGLGGNQGGGWGGGGHKCSQFPPTLAKICKIFICVFESSVEEHPNMFARVRQH